MTIGQRIARLLRWLGFMIRDELRFFPISGKSCLKMAGFLRQRQERGINFFVKRRKGFDGMIEKYRVAGTLLVLSALALAASNTSGMPGADAS